MAEAVTEMRAVYARTLVDIAGADDRIMVLEADLMKATGTGVFAKAFPERAVNVGVAEANMVGVAAGLSSMGRVPFAATFACFASRRAYDQFFLSANYARLNVKLVGTDPGVCAAFNGGTHMPFEDLALMRAVPELAIVEPSDPVSLAAFVRLAAAHPASVYLRLQRKAAPALYPESERFEFGKAKVLREGSDVVIAALGAVMVGEALKAADALKEQGKRAAVVDVLTLKPIDAETLLSLAAKSGRIVTAENHQISGGLGSAVAELVAEADASIRLKRVGVRDLFGEVGTQDWLMERFALTAADIVKTVESFE